MAERPEDLNLPNAVITRIIKEAVSRASGGQREGITAGKVTILQCNDTQFIISLKLQ